METDTSCLVQHDFPGRLDTPAYSNNLPALGHHQVHTANRSASIPGYPPSWFQYPTSLSRNDEVDIDSFISQSILHGMTADLQTARRHSQGSSWTKSDHTISKNQPIFCWLHGCAGRSFTNKSNYLRHCREKASRYAKPKCPRCGQEFLREKGRDVHVQERRCKIMTMDANGIATRVPLDDVFPV